MDKSRIKLNRKSASLLIIRKLIPTIDIFFSVCVYLGWDKLWNKCLDFLAFLFLLDYNVSLHRLIKHVGLLLLLSFFLSFGLLNVNMLSLNKLNSNFLGSCLLIDLYTKIMQNFSVLLVLNWSGHELFCLTILYRFIFDYFNLFIFLLFQVV